MHRVSVLALEGVLCFDLGIPFQVFGDARLPDGSPAYQVSLAGARSGSLRAYEGFEVSAPRGLRSLLAADTVVVPGLLPTDGDWDPALRALRRAHDRGTRIVSICTGSFVLAAAGLLDGRRATTHWAHAEAFARRFPSIDVDPSVLYVDEGAILTSAGAAAGLDLCLHVVATDLGAAAANQTARRSVTATHRSGGQAQYVASPVPGEAQGLQETRTWAMQRLDRQLSLSDLALHASVSRRTLIRRFQHETGLTPLRWLNQQRVIRARQLLEETELSVDEVARQSGFGSAAALRVHFRRDLRTHPQGYRATFRTAGA